MKERAIIFSGDEVRAVLDGRKTQFRRVVKPQPEFLYGLTAERITCMLYERKEANYGYTISQNTDIAERRLQGWLGRENIFSDTLRGLWSQGSRGLVSFSRAQKREWVFDGVLVPRKQEGDNECAPIGVHGVSRSPRSDDASNPPHGWKSGKQQAEQFAMGNASGKLDRPKSARPRDRGGKASRCEVHKRGAVTYPMGCAKGAVQPKTCGEDAGCIARVHWRDCKFQVGLRLWVRETWYTEARYDKTRVRGVPDCAGVLYAETGVSIEPCRRAVDMRRCWSRLTLAVTAVRVKRVQEISDSDALADDVDMQDCAGWPHYCEGAAVYTYSRSWNARNAEKGHGWDSNPWVWVVEFERVDNP